MNKILILVVCGFMTSFAEAKQAHICGSEFDVTFADYQLEQAVKTNQPHDVVQNLRKISIYQKHAQTDLNRIRELEERAAEASNLNADDEQAMMTALNADVVANCARIVGLQSPRE